MTADFAENKEGAAGRGRQIFIDMHACCLFNVAASNEVEGEKGLLAWTDELGGEGMTVGCVSLQLSSNLDREKQRDTEEDRQRGRMKTRARRRAGTSGGT